MKCFMLSLALFELLLWHKGSALFLDRDCDATQTNPDPSTAPWMVAVMNQYWFVCGGTLITKNFVLTTATCIFNHNKLSVQLGGSNYNVSRAIIHPDFNISQYTNDIALLKLNAEVIYTDHIRPICILLDRADKLQSINRFSAFVRSKTETIQLHRLPSKRCTNIIPLQPSQLCADSRGGSRQCNGDGGGPLVAIAKNRTVQVGILSYGPSFCNGPAVYTDVASFKNWISSQVKIY